MFHLAWFLGGFAPQGWPDNTRPWRTPGRWVDLAQELESARFDFMICEDSSWVPNAYGESHDFYVRNAVSVPKQDPAVLGTVLLSQTERIGIVPTLSTSEWEPYGVARAVGTMDQISRGRAGWNIVTGHSDLAPQNYGRDGLPPHDERYDRATEFVQVVTGLWRTWEPGAIHDDPSNPEFADPAKVHRLDYQGRWYRSRGPLGSGPPTQEQPLLLQAGGSPRGMRFAADFADVVISSSSTIEEARNARRAIRECAIAAGRDPDSIKVLFLVSPIVAETDERAEEILAGIREAARENPARSLARTGYTVDVDLAPFDPDDLMDDIADQLHTNGNVSSLQNFIELGRGLTIREFAAKVSWSRRMELIGSPEKVADLMEGIMAETDGDGFLFSLLDAGPNDLVYGITRGLVPELQARGSLPKEYEHEHVRDNVFAF